MEKQIQLNTQITDNGTNIKYSIMEVRKDGFVCKSISSAKKIPNEEFTFEEINNLFKENKINIGDFEHNDADNRLVELIMLVYIKDSLINEFQNSVSTATLDKNNISAKYSEMELLLVEKDKTIEDCNTTIERHEKTISEQQGIIQNQKDELQTKKDEIKRLTFDLNTEKEGREKDKQSWKEEEEEYKNTIAGLESIEN